jgi:hypothetical protein
MVTQEEGLKTKEQYESYYMKIEGVVGMGFDGTNILIYVTQLTPQLASFLPNRLDQIPVKIVVTGGKVVPMG